MTTLVIVSVLLLSSAAAIVFYCACVLGARADRISEEALYYQQYADWLDTHCPHNLTQGIPTDAMIDDMALEDEIEHEQYMKTHYYFWMKIVCPVCGRSMIHRISQWAYVDLTALDTAVQDAITEEDGITYSMVTLSKFCSMDCIENATQGCTFDIEWYPCRDPRARYLCDGRNCMNTQCSTAQGYNGEY
jgi:hypothetical protein